MISAPHCPEEKSASCRRNDVLAIGSVERVIDPVAGNWQLGPGIGRNRPDNVVQGADRPAITSNSSINL